MPSMKYAGSPTGSGNPPGQYSKSYLDSMESSENFLTKGSYRGDMHVGINSRATMVGNQPKSKSTSTLESESNHKMSY